jgi:hypothetical protein
METSVVVDPLMDFHKKIYNFIRKMCHIILFMGLTCIAMQLEITRDFTLTLFNLLV